MLSRTTLWLIAVAALLAPVAGSATEATPQATIDFGEPEPAQALEQYRGREGLQLNIQETRATLSDNVASRNQTGHNTISDGSFSGAVGFPVAVQNTGNNVIIQNAFIINLDVR